MSVLLLVLLLSLGLLVGGFGALAGVGGGFLLVPALVLFFHASMHEAVALGLIAVIATSTATSAVQVERGVTDIRLGFVLELATTCGAIIASLVAAYLSKRTLASLLVLFLAFTIVSMARKAWAVRAQKEPEGIPDYTVRNYPLGLGAGLTAGGMSGLLGIGGGIVLVPVMLLYMGMPTRVATATSNFMIGVTAATSAWIWYSHGYVNVAIAGPLLLGVMLGSHYGARNARKVKSQYMITLLVFAATYLCIEMLLKIKAGTL
jgi:uncharacterized protein